MFEEIKEIVKKMEELGISCDSCQLYDGKVLTTYARIKVPDPSN